MPFLPRPQKLKGMVGDKGFDPLGLSDWVPVEWLRESELKHGRVCMLAVLGFVATDVGFRIPGAMHQVASINAHDMAVEMGGMTQILTWIAVAECIGYLAILEMLDGSGRQPGDFGFDPLQIGGANDPEMQLKEIENGRLAMLAFAGIVTQAVLTGKGFPYF
jgi:light-harvesting complex I chlorophyll a/b binding protein 1